MTVNSRKVFDFLKQVYPTPMTAQELVKAINDPEIKIATVTGSVNGLVKKNYAVRNVEEKETAEGKTETIKYIVLTEAGAAFDPDAETDKK